MTRGRLLVRSMAFYWRTNLAVALGAAVTAAVLVGALAVGDSVRRSLHDFALQRLGKVEFAIAPRDRLFRSALAEELSQRLNVPVAPALMAGGVARSHGGQRQASGVQIVGVDERFWDLASGGAAGVGDGGVLLNRRLAEKLGASAGDDIVLRLPRPSLLPAEAPLSMAEDSLALRATVAAVVSDEQFGRFGLSASQVPPYNAFVSLGAFQKRTGAEGKANLLLISQGPSTEQAELALRKCWQFPDAGVEIRYLPERGETELRTPRVFLDPAVVEAAIATPPDATGVLTYFVNELRAGDHSTPYSMATAMGALKGGEMPAPLKGLRDDEVVINDWLATDLKVGSGDEISMTYFILGPMRELTERTDRFRIHSVVPLRGPAGDTTLMPDFPGLAESESCRQWKGGLPIHVDRIRDVDEAYWREHRGTPKAFVTLAAGRRMWGNRFGDLTAIRYQPSSFPTVSVIRQKLDPAAVGLAVLPVREQALAASSRAMDFGQLFLGLSFFLIASGLVLTGLLFVFNVEQRAEQAGVLLSMGWRRGTIRRLLLAEGAVLSTAGAAAGMPLGLLYAWAMIQGLGGVWSAAVAGSALHFHAAPASLAIGAAGAIVASLAAMWLALRRQTRQSPRELLAERGAPGGLRPTSRRRRIVLAALAALLAVAAGGIIVASGFQAAAGTFFASGALALAAGAAMLAWALASIVHERRGGRMSLGGLALRGAARRGGGSLAVALLAACGAFMIVSVAANRIVEADASARSSGTGGFALYAETASPVFYDPATRAGRKALRLPDPPPMGTDFVALRAHQGDDASCLNLNRAQLPRLLGIPVDDFARRGAFSFVRSLRDGSWRLLEQDWGPGVVPAVGDEATVTWGLGKKLGDCIDYRDGRGARFQIRIVGMIANSIFQGSLLISQRDFLARFPDEAGWGALLADVPADQAATLASLLEDRLADSGLEASPASQRLAEFSTVQNTYLAIFQTLGAIGMILGAAGVGIVVARNVLERRGELAVLSAVGFTRRRLRRVIFLEHAALLLLGLLWGAAAGLLAAWPAWRGRENLPALSMASTLSVVLLSGLLWTHIAARWSLRGRLIGALRRE